MRSLPACKKCRVALGKKDIKEKHLDTTQGWTKYGRYRYQCHKCKEYYYPADEELELSEASRMSPKKENQISYLSVQMPYEQAVKGYKELTGLPASRSVVHRVVQKIGEKIKVEDVKHKSLKGEGKEHVGADGVMVNIRKEGWKEMKIGAHYKVDVTEEREMKDVRYVATSGSREQIGKQLYKLAGCPTLEESEKMGFIGDGANWIEEIRAEHFAKSTGILDYYHAAEYVGNVGKSFYTGKESKQWTKKKLKQLKAGRIRCLENSFEEMLPITGEQRKALTDTRRYFKNHKHKMKYNVYKARGFHIGSGVIEAGCKHVIQNRFKRTGMRWSRKGVENLLALRVAHINNDWADVRQTM